MSDYKTFLLKLNDNLNILLEREAKYGGNAPLELVNQIADHWEAIALTEQAMRDELSQVEWREGLKPLLVAIEARTGEVAGVSLGEIGGGIEHSIIAGGDVQQTINNVVVLMEPYAAGGDRELPPAVKGLLGVVLGQVGAIDSRTARNYRKNPTGYKDPLSDALTELLEADRGLTARLEALLEQYRQTVSYQAEVSGSGAAAQGDQAKAVGKQGVMADTIHGPVVTGDKSRVIQAETYVENQVIGGQPGPDSATLRTAYLNHLYDACSRLSLAGVDPKAASGEAEARLNLSGVYTALLTIEAAWDAASTEGEGRNMRRPSAPVPGLRSPVRLSALAQLNQHHRLVLLGDPGSGKSTFVNFVTMCLTGEMIGSGEAAGERGTGDRRPGTGGRPVEAASSRSVEAASRSVEAASYAASTGRREANLARLTAPLPDDEGQDEEEGQPWTHGLLLPVRIILRDLAARGLPEPGQKATAKHLWDFIVTELESAGLGDYAPHLRQELLKQGGLLLLDGLDEVPEANQRRVQLKQVVEEFAATYSCCRVVVTSRTYAYQKQEWRLSGFAETVLAPFSQGQIRRFVDRWYAHVAELRGLHRDDAQGRAEILKRAIFNSDRLQALAERPLLLTLMASLHAWRGGSLPEKREELYANTVDLLLDWWEKPKTAHDKQGQVIVLQPSLAEWLKVERDKVRVLLNELAYQAHAGQPELVGTADVDEDKLVGGLMRLSENPEVKPGRLVEYLSQRAGLLLPRGVGVYTFPHRTFQEYLAACYLTDHDFPDRVAELARAEPNRWREVALLAGAKAARGTASAVWSLVEALCYREPEAGNRVVADVWGAHLAGQALVETTDLNQVSERNRVKVKRVRGWLVHIVGGDDLPAVDRVGEGDVLARLGDPRPGVGLRPDGLPDIAWCQVPAGPFLMGSDKSKDRQAEDGEQPQHTVTLPGYRIGKYPVTQAQFQTFVQAGGYGLEQYWPEARAAGYWQAGKFKGRFDKGRSRPSDYGHSFDLSNHPVVGVSWYEAIAFCHWLTERLRQTGEIGPKEVVTLPTEAEWEKAARGPDGRIYPWGDEFDSNRANCKETGIGATSAVGCFSGGVSSYGCLDMAGNVWEWCLSLYKLYPYRDDDRNDLNADGYRVRRGGSWWGSSLEYARVSCRGANHPVDFIIYDGFRVVVAPVFS